MNRISKIEMLAYFIFFTVLIGFVAFNAVYNYSGGCGCPTTCTIDGQCVNGCCFNHEICNEPPYGNDSLNIICDWGCP